MKAGPRLAVGAAIGAVLGILAALAALLPSMLASGGNSFMDAQGDVRLRAAALRPGEAYALEIDRCSASACADARPWFGGSDVADAKGEIQAEAPPPPEATWLRWRAFPQTGAAVTGAAAEAWTPATDPPFGVAAVLFLVSVAAGAGVALLASMALPVPVVRSSAPPAVRAPAAEPAPKKAKPAPAAEVPSGAKTQSLLTVCDAATKLPLGKVKLVSRQTGASIPVTPSQDAGRFLVEHWADEEAEVRVAGYDALPIRLTRKPVLAEMPARRRTFRVRVVGSASRSPLAGVPVRLARGTQVLVAGVTGADGELPIDVAELHDDDLAETAVGVVGFVESKARVWQAPADGVIELPLAYEFHPSAAQEKAAADAGRAADAAAATWARVHPDLAAVFRSVLDAIRAPLGAPDEWGRGLLLARVAPAAVWDALVASVGETAAMFRTLFDDAVKGQWAPSVPRSAHPLVVDLRFEPDWSRWLAAQDPRDVERLRAEVEGLRLRAQSLPSPGARALLARWLDVAARPRPGEGAKGAAARLAVESHVAFARWYLARIGAGR